MSRLAMRLAKLEAGRPGPVDPGKFALVRWHAPRPNKWGNVEKWRWVDELCECLSWCEPDLTALVYCDGREDIEEVIAPAAFDDPEMRRFKSLDRAEFNSGTWWSADIQGGRRADVRNSPRRCMDSIFAEADSLPEAAFACAIYGNRVDMFEHNLSWRLKRCLGGPLRVLPNPLRFAVIQGPLSRAAQLPNYFKLAQAEPCAVLVTEAGWDGGEPVLLSPPGTFDEALIEAFRIMEATIGCEEYGGREDGGSVVSCLFFN